MTIDSNDDDDDDDDDDDVKKWKEVTSTVVWVIELTRPQLEPNCTTKIGPQLR